MTRWILLALLLVASAALLTHVLAASAFRARTETLTASLGRTKEEEAPAARGIPAIVAAFARRAAPEGAAPRLVRIRQRAEVRQGPGAPWHPPTAEETVSVRVPGFVWVADAEMAPLVWARVVDAYVDGKGLLEARLFGSVPVASTFGTE